MAINKHYTQLEFGSGLFFLYSKEEKEGYEKHTSTKGNESFRKYFKEGISGTFESASIYTGDYGSSISLNVKDGDDVYYVPVSLTDQAGNVDNTYAESLIKLLPLLNKGDQVVVKGYNFKPEGSIYSKIGMSITCNGEKLKSAMTNAYYKEGNFVEGDIPAIVWKKDLLGKNKPTAVSLEAKNDYLQAVLLEQIERLKWVKDESVEPNVEKTVTPKPITPKAPESDLPF